MASLDWHLRSVDGITLVELVVRSQRDERIRVESALDPVWPPRTQGVPVEGWDETGFSGTVEAGDPLVLGYASPADPVEPPARLDTPRDPNGGTDIDARSLVRALGDPAPPREAVPEHGSPIGEHNEVEEWFDAVEERLVVAQRLAAATDAAEARAAVDTAGGIAAVRRLATALEADEQRLDRLARQVARLDERVSATDVPLATLERVA